MTFTSGFTCEIQVNNDSNVVTMTLVGPANRWLGVAFDPSSAGMGSSGDDLVVYNNQGLQDRTMNGGFNSPSVDVENNWITDTDTTENGVRTLVVSRSRISSDNSDYTFPSAPQSITLLWAMGSSLNFGYHNSRGAFVATLSTGQYELTDFSMYPNPMKDELNLNFSQFLSSAEFTLFNNLGQQVMHQSFEGNNIKINTKPLPSGMYIMQLEGDGRQAIRRLIKE
ncbi:MAG: T9SS type A sorting domain-containing protein [Flavobacteriaceae bacterium]|nr:T9SS type A sorting domain-containing protein [Flavobacteriaceae bacterium]